MQILQDWAHDVTYEADEIDKERGVVVEEWRLGQGAADRMRRKYFPVLFHDSHYADRITIGKKEIIEQAPYDTLRKFYHDWYRPDLMAVIVVGDVDPGKVETLIKEKFSAIPNPPAEKPRVTYPVPDHKDLLVSVATDKEATFTGITLEYKHPLKEQKTVEDYRNYLAGQLFTTMLDHRYTELIQQADPPFAYASSGYGSLVRTKDTYSNFAVVQQDAVEKGLQALLQENERVKRFGFTQSEFDRAKKEMLRNTEKAYNERGKTESRNYTGEYVSYFLEHTPSPGIEWEYKMKQELLGGISQNDVNALASQWITDGENCAVIITAPEKAGCDHSIGR
jgi:zinc protease